MEILLNRLKESISNTSNSLLYELCLLINTEVFKRYRSGELKGFFSPGEHVVYTDDDGCILFGEIADTEEFHSLNPDHIFIKEIDPSTNQNFIVEDEVGNFLVSGTPMMNEAQVFKYALDEERLGNV